MRADFDWTKFTGLLFVLLIVGLKLLEVVFRKITQARHKVGDKEFRIVEEEPAPPPQAKGPYLPYEETVEKIFAPYIELRKCVHREKQQQRQAQPPRPPPPRPAPRLVLAAPVAQRAPREDVVIEEAIEVIQEPPPAAEPPSVARPRGRMTPEQARKAVIASVILSPPVALRRRRMRA